ncbi:styrene monooxygenase subunit (plasmid) [Pseudomonas putida S12]|uniref:Styrene monooxygenase subunit n=1 Tax=Pseudomonas putida S12 TaxID=1215087 RepID=A0AA34S0U9_PSEPU|nr:MULTISPECIES: flavin reductase family protein [Pseudomonas]AAC23719.1 styrene monooxygenase small component [Pseudomonas sp. VLB120]AGZ38049.1 putative FMN-binding flavin reductase [Pseudomonas sp. VLB120]AJA17114.1 styrene monooxygenase subunit [Pseudomonas putida S12]
MTLKKDMAVDIDSTNFRQAVALFATGIAVLSAETEEGDVHGMTVNSFTSISLDPPTVMVSLKSGRMHELLTQGGRFGVSLLGESQKVFSAFFSKRAMDDTPPPAFTIQAGLPTLQGAMAWFECEVESTVQVHDHTLFIARVSACGTPEANTPQPLLFFASRYHGNPLPLN